MINLKQQKLTHSYGLSVEQFPIDFDKFFKTALNCFTSLCDSSRKLVPHFNQSDPKLKKLITTWSLEFSRARRDLPVFTLICHRLRISFALIGWCNSLVLLFATQSKYALFDLMMTESSLGLHLAIEKFLFPNATTTTDRARADGLLWSCQSLVTKNCFVPYINNQLLNLYTRLVRRIALILEYFIFYLIMNVIVFLKQKLTNKVKCNFTKCEK